MKAVIVGCGRVGAALADDLDRAGWQVLIIDISPAAFDRLPSSFGGTALRGDGTDEDTLRRAGAEGADLFLSLTEGDNRNVMAAQLATDVLGAGRTIAKINDPVRAEAYAHLGVATLCRTNLMTTTVLGFVGMTVPERPGLHMPARLHAHGEATADEVGGGVATGVAGFGETEAAGAPRAGAADVPGGEPGGPRQAASGPADGASSREA